MIAATGWDTSLVGTGATMVPAQAMDTYVSVTLVVWAGIVVLALLLTSGGLTLGKSISEYYADRRRDAVAEAVRTRLYDQLDDDAPEISSWVESLSETERNVLEAQVRELVDVVSGSDRDRLVELAVVLGLRDAARESIEDGDRRERLHGLSTLVAFEWEVEANWLTHNLKGNRSEREAAIRILGLEPTERDRRLGVDLAFADGSLSVYGVDALFRLVRENPSPLLSELDCGEVEDPRLLRQALLVVGHAETSVGKAPMGGVVRLLQSEHAVVRAGAVRALGPYGWRDDVRAAVDIEALVSDPEMEVRVAAYRTLGAWGDRDATELLVAAAETESKQRARLIALQQLGEEAAWVLETDVRRDSLDRLRPWVSTNEELHADTGILR